MMEEIVEINLSHEPLLSEFTTDDCSAHASWLDCFLWIYYFCMFWDMASSPDLMYFTSGTLEYNAIEIALPKITTNNYLNTTLLYISKIIYFNFKNNNKARLEMFIFHFMQFNSWIYLHIYACIWIYYTYCCNNTSHCDCSIQNLHHHNIYYKVLYAIIIQSLFSHFTTNRRLPAAIAIYG